MDSRERIFTRVKLGFSPVEMEVAELILFYSFGKNVCGVPYTILARELDLSCVTIKKTIAMLIKIGFLRKESRGKISPAFAAIEDAIGNLLEREPSTIKVTLNDEIVLEAEVEIKEEEQQVIIEPTSPVSPVPSVPLLLELDFGGTFDSEKQEDVFLNPETQKEPPVAPSPLIREKRNVLSYEPRGHWGDGLKDAVALWLSYKSERGQKYKPKGYKMLCDQIDQYSESYVISEIIRSITNNYQGFHLNPDKKTRPKSNQEPLLHFATDEEKVKHILSLPMEQVTEEQRFFVEDFSKKKRDEYDDLWR